MDNSAADLKFDESAPEGAGPLVETLTLESPPIEEPGPIRNAGPLRMELPTATLKVDFKNYLVYQKIRYSASIATSKGPVTFPKLTLKMYSGQGWFEKVERNASAIKYTEEKYATFVTQSDIKMILVCGDDTRTFWQVEYP